jgi:hypothetical protein
VRRRFEQPGHGFQRRHCRLEIRRLAVYHVAPKGGVATGKVGVGSNAFDGAQRFRKRIVAIGRELVAVSLCVGLHDLAR